MNSNFYAKILEENIPTIIKTIDSSDVEKINVIYPINEDAEYGKAMYDDLTGMLSITNKMVRRGRKSIKKVYKLRVREIATGRVSKFSNFKIVAEKPEFNSNIPFFLKIKAED